MADDDVLRELRANSDHLATLVEKRDKLIRRALMERRPQQLIAEASDLSQPGISGMAKRWREQES